MKTSVNTWIIWMISLAFLFVQTRCLLAQETHWLNLKPPTAFVEVDVESETDTETSGKSRISSDRLYIAPTIGLDLGGSVYHPNLLQFNFKGQGGYLEQDVSSQTGPAKQSSSQTSFLQEYDLSGTFLQNKPYAATFTASKTHTFQELDDFNQVMVDSQGYGARFGYAAGPVPFSVSLKHQDETETGLLYNNQFQQDSLDLTAQNRRTNGNTTLSYTAGQYTQVTSDVSQKQMFQYGTLQDDEKFWKDDRGRLTSSAYFSQEDQLGEDTRTLTLQESLSLRHTPCWDSFYSYNFNDDSMQSADTIAHTAMIGVRNQLYDSLSSSLNVHGFMQDATSSGSSLSASIYGVANTESYSKRLGEWGHLTLGNSVQYDITDENNAGTVTSVFNEQHVLTDGTPAFLLQPRVLSVTKVTDSTGARVYIQGIDYDIISVGELTRIERIPTSLNLPNNTTVLVNYTVQSQPSGSFTTLSENVQLRLDLFNGLADIYTGLGWVENQAPADFVLENSFTTLSGFDVVWRWLRAGGTYQTQQGNLLSYTSDGLYQTATFKPVPASTISINAREEWSHYAQPQESVADYTLTGRFSERFDGHIEIVLEAGAFKESGGTLEQTLFTAGARVKYSIGKLFLSLTYQFNQQQIPDGSNMRNFVGFTARRDL